MSYDLIVFVPEDVPQEREVFLAWFGESMEWSEGLDYDDPANCAPQRQSRYRDMLHNFPAMNGPDRTSVISDHVTGYSCSRSFINADFRWSVASEAFRNTLMYAATHGIGFFDASGSGAEWLRSDAGYRVAHGGSEIDQKVEEALAKWIASRG